MDRDKTPASYTDRVDDEPLTLRRQFRLSRALTDDEVAVIYRYVPEDAVHFDVRICFWPNNILIPFVRFSHWYNLPFRTQTLLELTLPCR